ncbi:MAG TPA: transketolase C-terminal domain-containing protein [Candidatus Latescibacteria bacterium]|nr:transketolase C-terminal domain-containing protein [Candidatus Latescibacterota bacterium]MEE3039377.1 transketolase C-terminal domain-containing protein [Candidatus Latescibacterota bacterium]MEE3261358.1 transketolase C-terminal domain-containing protein [Candidatus Latescibacterota bacterium]HJN28926.1 transketolase C-terminal domain-containing protein [Candidatus Latescibacterota bacterium]
MNPSFTMGDEMVAQRDVFGQTLIEMIDTDPRVYVLDGDLANSTKADMVARQRPDRFLQMGIAEQNMMGVAAGMASCGLIPWLSSFAVFLVNRDLDQVRVVVAQPGLNVKIAGAYTGLLTGKTGKTHQDVSDISVMRSMPGMTVIAPADGVETRAAMLAANNHDGPVYMRFTRDPQPQIFSAADGDDFQIGKARVLREGGDISLITTGEQSVRALVAAQLLQAEGISALVLHVPTIKPLDVEAIVAAASTGCVVTGEDHTIVGGLGSAVAEALSEHRPTRLIRMGIEDVFGESAENDDLLEKHQLTPQHMAATARRMLSAHT